MLLAFKVGVHKKKSATPAIPAKVWANMISLVSSQPGVESFSKFDGQQLCSPFIYRPHISSNERSKPF